MLPAKNPRPVWQRALLFSLGYFTSAWVSTLLSDPQTTYVSFWLPSGLYLAVLLLNEFRAWPWLMLAALPANFVFDLLHGTPAHVIPFFWLANTVEAGLGAWLVRRFVTPRPQLASLAEFGGHLAFPTVLTSMLGAVIGAATLVHFQIVPEFLPAWKVWWGSTAMALLLFGSFILAWFAPVDAPRKQFNSPRKIIEALALLGITAVYMTWLFRYDRGIMSPSRVYAVPLLMWAGLRFGTRGATALVLAAATTTAFCTTRLHVGLSPEQIATHSYDFLLQSLLSMQLVLALVPAIVLEERDRKTSEVRAREAQLRAMFDHAAIGVSLADPAGQFVKCNPAFEKLLGYTETELLALNFRDVTHPEDLTNDAHAYRALVAGECENYQIKKRYLRRDGQLVWARLTVSLVRGEHGEPRFAVGMVEDITERQRAAEALRASQESLRASIENTPNVAVQWYDLQGRVVFWNRASENIFGWTAAEALGKTLDEMLFTREQHEGFVAALQTIAANGQPIGPVEFPFRYRSGATGTLVSTVFQIPGPNGELRFVCMDVDITERKRAEAEREAAVAREQATRVTYTLQLVAAQEAERARIAGELHDSLGQELLLIKNRAQLALAGENIPADLRAQLTGIGELATQAIGEVRQISRDLHPHQLDHLGLTRALSAMIESSTRAAKIPCEQRIETVDDLFTKAAATNLYRIVQESLNNLLKHAHATHASVRLERDVHELQLTIEDNGVGFDVAAGEQSPSGLGLKNIATRVQMLGGKLEIISTPGQGTRVEVKLPIAEKPNAFGSGI